MEDEKVMKQAKAVYETACNVFTSQNCKIFLLR